MPIPWYITTWGSIYKTWCRGKYFNHIEGPGWLNELGNNNSYKPITNTTWVHVRLCKLQKGCTRLAASSDKVYQLLAHGRRFSPGTPASSTTKTGRYDIAGILLKVALNTKQSINQSIKPHRFSIRLLLLIHSCIIHI